MPCKPSRYVAAFLLGAVAPPAFACDMPKLPVIPARDQIGDQAPAVTAAASAYFEGMRAYVACIQGALAAADGDAAPGSLKAVLSARNSAALTEAQAVNTLYREGVGTGQTATRATESALRQLLEGLATGMPDYDLLTPEMQRLTRQQLGNLQRDTAALGAIQSIEFGGVRGGWDTFVVRGESATMNARIHLDGQGNIDGALLERPRKIGEQRQTATLPQRH
jgi:hypothetical protein